MQSSLFGQVYVSLNGANWEKLNPEQSIALFSNPQSIADAVKHYEKRIKQDKIIYVDSVYLALETAIDGSILHFTSTFGTSQKHIDALKKCVKKLALLPKANYKMAWVFEKKNLNAQAIWQTETPPKDSPCLKFDKDTNIVFQLSCFNYLVESLLRDLPPPSPKKSKELFGKAKATVFFNHNGEIEMIEFDPSSKNPLLNDYYASQFLTQKFPSGGFKNGKATGYFVETEEEYFPILPPPIGEEKKRLKYEIVDYLALDRHSNEIPIPIDSTLLKLNFDDDERIDKMFLAIFEKENIQSPVQSPSYIIRVVQNNNYFVNHAFQIDLVNKSDLEKQAVPIACAQHIKPEEYSGCQIEFWLSHFISNFKMGFFHESAHSNTFATTVISERGEVEKIIISGGDGYPEQDLRVMCTLSHLPNFEPATRNGIPQPSISTIFLYTQ